MTANVSDEMRLCPWCRTHLTREGLTLRGTGDERPGCDRCGDPTAGAEVCAIEPAALTLTPSEHAQVEAELNRPARVIPEVVALAQKVQP